MSQSSMTTDEMTVETLRYRAPSVVALPDGRFAVLVPGWELETKATYLVADDLLSLWTAINNYTAWNQQEPRRVVRAKASPSSRAKALADLNITEEEFNGLLADISRAAK